MDLLALFEGFSHFGGKKSGLISRVALFGGPNRGGFITKTLKEKNRGQNFWPYLAGGLI